MMAGFQILYKIKLKKNGEHLYFNFLQFIFYRGTFCRKLSETWWCHDVGKIFFSTNREANQLMVASLTFVLVCKLPIKSTAVCGCKLRNVEHFRRFEYICKSKHTLGVLTSVFCCFSSTVWCIISFMENDGSHLFGLSKLFTRNSFECAVCAHGE